MPDKRVLARARKDASEGKSPSTQAGEFIREEIEHVREGKHGARSAKQAIAIGLSKARRAGVPLPPPKAGSVSEETRAQTARDSARGRNEPNKKPSPKRSRASLEALQEEGQQSASHLALSRQAHSSARKRGAASLKAAAKKAIRTKGEAGLKRAAKKGARTRAASEG
jgi:hypothetical protein